MTGAIFMTKPGRWMERVPAQAGITKLGLVLLAGTDLLSAHGGTEQRGKNAEVEQPRHQWNEPDHSHDNAAHTLDDQQTQGDKDNTCRNTDNAAGRGSYEFYKWVHFLFLLFKLNLIVAPSIVVLNSFVCDKVT
jgi:hypothetical protein